MSIPSTEESMSFSYFLCHPGSESLLMNSLEKQPSGPSEIQKFVMEEVSTDRKQIENRIYMLVIDVLLTTLFSPSPMGVFLMSCLTLYDLSRLAIRVSALYNSFQILQGNNPLTPATANAR